MNEMKHVNKMILLATNQKIKIKLLGIYLIATVIPILLVGFYLNYSMRDVVLDNTINEVNANVDKLEMRLNTTLDRAISISDLIYINGDLKRLLSQSYESNLEIYNAYIKHPIFDEYLKYYNEVENIRFFMTKEMITNSHFIYADEDIRSQHWYKKAVEKEGHISWEFIKDKWTNENYLTLTRAVFGEKDELLGVLTIYISPGNLASISKKELFDVYISLDYEKIVHSKNHEMIGRRPYFIHNQTFSKGEKSIIYDADFKNEKVKIYLRSFQPKKTLLNEIQIAAIIPVKDVIHESNVILIRGFTIVILSLLISISLIALFIKSFDRRIYTLRHAMYNVAKGNFKIDKQELGGDEIGEVYRDLDSTVESIQQLINEVYIHKINEEQWKRRQKESEFKMLASQINPHFLYNTLEMIRMKALINKDQEVASIVKMLGKMMRYSLEVTNQPVPLKSEIDLVKTYLGIQKLRFGNKIDYKIDITCDIEKYEIFPLLLQPLVENSIIHGIVSTTKNIFVQVTILERDNNLVIKVIDNGAGISPLKIGELIKELDETTTHHETSNGIGLHNVSKRVKLYYGDNYGINLESELGIGTTITIYLPISERI